ncbi:MULTISPECIES: hypothetical protein [unclassified Mesorhizobium]|uniref:hypothetical protein n=1 Tax=unclassified Mesorhizobium TaxID=325217 RepID=UPI0013DF8F6A
MIPADVHLGGEGVQCVLCCWLWREAGDVPEHQRSAPKDDLKIRPKHVGYAIGCNLKFFDKGPFRSDLAEQYTAIQLDNGVSRNAGKSSWLDPH